MLTASAAIENTGAPPGSASWRELARQLTAIRPEMRVLFTSGYTAAGAGMTASLPRDARFIDKPFSPSGLVDAVRTALDGAAPSR